MIPSDETGADLVQSRHKWLRQDHEPSPSICVKYIANYGRQLCISKARTLYIDRKASPHILVV